MTGIRAGRVPSPLIYRMAALAIKKEVAMSRHVGPAPVYYNVRMYICITNAQAQTTSMELIGICPPLPSRR